MPGGLHLISELGAYLLSGNRLKATIATLLFLLFAVGPAVSSPGDFTDIRDTMKGSYPEEIIAKAETLLVSVESVDKGAADIVDTVEWMASSNITGSLIIEYLSLVSDLSGAGISPTDLSSKAREGLAKGVKQERIISVLRSRAESLKAARVLALALEDEGVVFLDRQMTYRILANYLSRGIKSEEIISKTSARDFSQYQALESVVK